MSETQETALQVGYESENWHSAIYAFNGDTSEGDASSTIEQYGAHVGYNLAEESWNVAIDTSYTSSLFDSDLLAEEFEVAATEGDYIPGFGVQGVLGVSNFTFIAEYITALEDLDVEGNKINPYTFNVEGAVTVELVGYETILALAWQNSDDLAGILPEQRFMASIGVSLFEDTTLTLEYAYDKDYDEHDGGSDDNSKSLTAQLAYEF